jgi:hypothetical protein
MSSFILVVAAPERLVWSFDFDHYFDEARAFYEWIYTFTQNVAVNPSTLITLEITILYVFGSA